MLNEYRRWLIFEHTYLSLRAARWCWCGGGSLAAAAMVGSLM